MHMHRVTKKDECIVHTYQQTTRNKSVDVDMQTNLTFGELLCGQHQQLLKCVLDLKLQCT